MSTLVFFHAHPDDECIATGGTMAKAAAEGHRVVLVVATKGEHGEVDPDFLAAGEELWQRRERETEEAAHILGVQRLAFLGYVDSGMMGVPENDAPGSFWSSDVEEAAERLAAILVAESADVLTIYDDHGGYGHPDHIQVHRVGRRAAELAGTRAVFESTMNRDDMVRRRGQAIEAGADFGDEDGEEIDMGTPEALLTTAVDVHEYLEVKRSAMIAHASQIDEQSWFLTMPRPAFDAIFGTEWYVRIGAPAGIAEDRLV